MARSVLSADVSWNEHQVQSTAKIRQHQLTIDEPSAWGGEDGGANPVELILAGLGGCLTVLLTAFAPSHGVQLDHVTVHVEGDLDPDGFMGTNPSVRCGFSAIRYRIDLESQSSEENIAALIAHADRVCPVKDTLSGVPVQAL